MSAPRWFIVSSWVFACLFAVCVALQWNDPDPIRWMLVYGAAAVAAAMMPHRTEARRLGVVVAGVAAVWAIYLVLGIWGKVSLSDFWHKMSEKGGAVEEEREAGGLLIVATWLAVAGWFSLRLQRGRAT
jgi:hypothetical protein